MARLVLQVGLDRLDQRCVVSGVPRRARQAQRAVGTPGTQAVMGLHRQAQLQSPRLAQPFRDRTSFSAWCASARSAYMRLSRVSPASTSFRCRSCDTYMPVYLFLQT